MSGLAKIEGEALVYLLPSPRTEGNMSVEKAISQRRSRRIFLDDAISAEDLSQILWSAAGITKPIAHCSQTRMCLRAAPSAGAMYPLEIYVLAENVRGIEPGIYKYIPQEHKIIRVSDRDVKKDMTAAAQDRQMISIAPACLFYSAVFSRTTSRYGSRGREKYVCMDLGHSAENVYLQAEALNLGTCAVGAFDDALVKEIMQLPPEEEPLYIMPIGKYISKP